MFTRHGTTLLALAFLSALLVAWFLRSADEPAEAEPPPVADRTRDQLDLREGVLFERESSNPFTGLLVEFYPDGNRKVAIEIEGGRPHGLSRGWYRNEQLEVQEHFVQGVAHGPRTRWFENGRKRSEARIENGQIVGRFVQWHDNGRKAAEAVLVDGKPHGVCRGWHPSGAPKSRVELRNGEVVSREYWEDAPFSEKSARTGQ
jgi:antitoxin component YwqK of YwqJK toxin-antitoxin module